MSLSDSYTLPLCYCIPLIIQSLSRQSLLDSLQDLDRMIGVKYKVAESLSRKLLLQSLNLRTLNPVSLVVVYF